MSERRDNLPLIVSPGTQVVTLVEQRGPRGDLLRPMGAVGVVVRAPADHTHAYRVRFPDGVETPLRRRQFAIRKHYQREGIELARDLLAERELYDYVIYRCIVGSRAFGLDEPDSDTDRRGIYLPPASLHWSLYGVPEQLEDHDTQECYWELGKFLVLALKANPNVLECLYTPLVEHTTPLARGLRGLRDAFLSKLVYQTYNGYVLSQFKKLEQDLRTRGEIRWKHAMHLIRLLLGGIGLLRDGALEVRVEEHRDRLLAVRRAQLAWDDVNAWRLDLHRQLDAAYADTRLPDQPDYERANAFLIRARRSMVDGGD